MKKQIILLSSALLLTSGLHALTTEEQVAANSMDIEKLKSLIVKLEALHNIRQFTIKGTSGLDITESDFRNQITSLKYTPEEYLYLKGVGQEGISEICTSHQFAFDIINSYILDEGTYVSRTGFNYPNNWFRTDKNPEWTQPSYIAYSSDSSIEHLSFYARNSENTKVTSMSVLPDHFDDGILRVRGSEVYVEHWDNIGDNSIVFKVGATRMEACGF